MRVAFCGGGTGGHVFPALTVANTLRQHYGGENSLELLYIGVRGKSDRELVSREAIPFRSVLAGPLRARNPVDIVVGLLKLLVGTVQAYRILRQFRPDVVFATGGYGSVGVGLAAWLLRRPLLLFLPDVEAGIAVRALSRFARRIAVTVPPALNAVPKAKSELLGYPVRQSFFGLERDDARQKLGLHLSLPTLLISGGSTGASRINDAVSEWIGDFLRVGQVVHVCGTRDQAFIDGQRAALPEELQERYHLHAFLHEEMPLALAAADLGIMRAGASTLGELPAARLPAILIPGEFDGGSNQRDNARFLEQSGAALVLPQTRIDELHSTVMDLLADTPRREQMKRQLAGMARPYATDRLAHLVARLAGVQMAVTA